MDFRLFQNLRNRAAVFANRHPGALPLALGTLLGLGLAAGLADLVRYSDSNEFCLSCHEMAQAPYQEYLQSTHYRNRLGIRAGCADCHLPHDSWLAYAKAKIAASKDVFHHLAGTLGTPEKFEGLRPEMARRVWRDLKDSDSAPCRGCHDVAAMDPEQQGSGDMHQRIGTLGKTCVDCHQGLAHRLR
jgi:nitrate/TMAO reductase-like tetraheme cytochrome c subunit